MNILQQLQARFGQAFGDVPMSTPQAPVMSAAVQSQQPVAIALESWRPNRIDARDFVAAEPFQASQWFKLGEFEVPSETVWRIQENQPFRLMVPAITRRAGNNAAAASRNVIIAGLFQSPYPAPALGGNPSLKHPSVRVWCLVDAVWSPAVVTAINWGTGQVSYNEPLNCTNVEIYFLHTDGEVRFRAYRKLGNSDTNGVSLFNSSMGAVHASDQRDIEASSAVSWPREVTLGDDYTLGLEVRSTLEHVISARSHLLVNIPAYVREVATVDAVRKAQISELDLRGGL